MASEAVLVDTGAFAALFDPTDPYHNACVAAAKALPVGKTYTCWPVITETAYLLRHHHQRRDELLRAMVKEEFVLLSLESDDLVNMQDIFDKYHDQDVDLADAALVQLADREGIDVVFTIDRRHFCVFRQHNGNPFRLLPDSEKL